MQKSLTSYVKVIDNKLFQFMCEPDAQTVHAKEFLFEVIKWIGDIEEYVKSQHEAEKAKQTDISNEAVAEETEKNEVA